MRRDRLALFGGLALDDRRAEDEIGDDAERRRAARALEAWTQQHGGRCWVTTRKHDALTLVDRFTTFELSPFEPSQIHEYLVRRRDPRAAMWL